MMADTSKALDEKRIHRIFRVSLFLKGAFAISEIVGGILACVVPQQFVLNVVAVLTQAELAEDPRDLVATSLLNTAQHISAGTRYFTAAYLVSHGAIKLWLILGLLREKFGYYPTAMVIFGLFIVYQLYRFSFAHSILLLLITVLDVVIIALTWHEYRYLRHQLPSHR